MKVFDRASGAYFEEQEYQQGLLRFLYETLPGRLLLKLAVSPAFSRWRARYQHSPRSKKDILPFAERYGVALSEDDLSAFESFNDFFTRKRSCTTSAAPSDLIAIADGRLSVYPVSDQLALSVKHSRYTLGELVGNDVPLSAFSGGSCLVFRLAVQDYHRYVFPDSGEVIASDMISGELHTVRPLSERYRVFARNHRVWTMMDTAHFGPMLQVEVGAMLVGKIQNHPVRRFSRLDEKGWFEFGGSTILLLLPKSVRIDEDILAQSRMGYETKVSIGERIGTIIREEE